MLDYQVIVADLEALRKSASDIEGWQSDHVETLIRGGEYSLALDEIASAYLTNKVVMPSNLFRIFERLAVELNMEADEEYEAAAKLLAVVRPRPA